MKIDPRQLRVAEAVRLLNSTPLGEVTGLQAVYGHLNRAGYAIAAAQGANRIDLLKYVAWLYHQRREVAPSLNLGDGGGYASRRDAVNSRERVASESSRDLALTPEGWVHEPVDAARRDSCRRNFQGFCETYLKPTFHLPWSKDHLKVIAKIETAVLEGGLFALAMPRGSGKTTLCEVACLWSLLYGHREFVTLIGADEEHAAGMLASIQSELENNDLLEEDFSEICGPIRALDGIHQRAGGQLFRGERTQIGWTAKEIVLPTIPGSAASGAVVRVAGITGRIRGMKAKRSNGQSIRPSLVLLDDPQTDESARSPAQCATREQILSGAILGLAGPGRKIAGLMTLTVVQPGDMADRMLDREKHPAWQGERTKMVYRFPAPGSQAEKLWERYAQVRGEGLRSERGTEEATTFYRVNQAAMDAGMEVAWPERLNPDELSAVQHAMNLKLDQGDAAFFAEYQNEPLTPEGPEGQSALPPEAIVAKANGIVRGMVPAGCAHLTCFIDVQKTLLFFAVVAWKDDFTGHVVEYGAFPDQGRPYFVLREAKRTLASLMPTATAGGGSGGGSGGDDAVLLAGLERVTGVILTRDWPREDGTTIRVERCLIDANWGQSTETVRAFCRRSPHAGVLMPSHGRYVGAASVPISDKAKTGRDRVGLQWRESVIHNQRHLLFDTNFWKSFLQSRLSVAKGDKGGLTLFGKAADHAMLGDHLSSEYPVSTTARGRTVEEWHARPGQDNHLLDCVVGAAAAASLMGCSLLPVAFQKPVKKRIKLSELAAKKRWG